MACPPIIQRVYILLVNIFRPSRELAPKIGCIAANVSFILKSRHPSVLSPEDIDIVFFTEDDASTELGKCTCIVIVRHNGLERYMQVELRVSVPMDDVAMLLHMLEGNVLHEVKRILQPLKQTMYGSRIPYLTLEERAERRKEGMDEFIRQAPVGIPDHLQGANNVVPDPISVCVLEAGLQGLKTASKTTGTNDALEGCISYLYWSSKY